MEIRKIKPPEIDKLSGLHERIFEKSFSHYNEEQGQRTLELWTKQRIKKRLENPSYVILVAVEGGKLIGFIAFRVRYKKLDSYINWMGVDENYQGRGIGGELVKRWVGYVAEHAPEIELLRASTSKKENIEFYKKLGFILAEEKVVKSGMKKYLLIRQFTRKE